MANLSNVELSESESSLLSKGLGFCPRPKSYDRGELVEDTYAFSRRMRLKSHFSGFLDTRVPEKYPEFVEKSDWQPPKQGRDLETFISSVESDKVKHRPPIHKHDNLKPSERSALHSLRKREDIIIKTADKETAVVVMDREHYMSLVLRKPVFGVFDQVRHKPVCTVIEDG